MKKIKELHVKYDIHTIAERMFLLLVNAIERIARIIIHMPFYVVYVNAFMFILGKFGGMNDDVILKALYEINTVNGYVNIFIYVIMFFVLRWVFRGVLSVSNNDRECPILGKKVSYAVAKNDMEEMVSKQKAKFVLYENGVIKESKVLEYDPNEKFTVSNMELEKTYLLLKEDIKYE